MIRIYCAECSKVVFEWTYGDVTERPAEMDIWNPEAHICDVCKPKFNRMQMELTKWQGEELSSHKVKEVDKIKELEKKYFNKGV